MICRLLSVSALLAFALPSIAHAEAGAVGIALFRHEASLSFPAAEQAHGCTPAQVASIAKTATDQAMADCRKAGLRCAVEPADPNGGSETRFRNGVDYVMTGEPEEPDYTQPISSYCSAKVLVQGTKDANLALPVKEHGGERFRGESQGVYAYAADPEQIPNGRCVNREAELGLIKAATQDGLRQCQKLPGVVACGVIFPDASDQAQMSWFIANAAGPGKIQCTTDVVLIPYYAK